MFNCFTINFITDSYHDVVLHHDANLYSEDYVTYELIHWFIFFMYSSERHVWHIWEDVQIDNVSYSSLNDDLIRNFKKYKKMRVKALKGSNFVENHYICDNSNSDSVSITSNLNILNCSKLY